MRRLFVVTAALATATIAAGCGGSGTETVNVSSPPRTSAASAQRITSTTRSAISKAPTQTTSSTAPSPTSVSVTSTTTSITTRTSTAPRFVTETTSSANAADAAAETVEHEGYVPTNRSEFHEGQTLQVLVAAKRGSSYEKRAFFFIDGKYIGTDASKPSASLRIVAQRSTEVTLAYGLYNSSDSSCCPSGGEAKVSFQLDNGELVALDPIPPASSSSASSRR